MRTTIDLPEDLHRVVNAIARDQGLSMSRAVCELLGRALGETGSATVERDELSGLKVITLGRTVTSDDVRALDDAE